MRLAKPETRKFWQSLNFTLWYCLENHPPWSPRPRPWLLLKRMIQRARRKGIPDEVIDSVMTWPTRKGEFTHVVEQLAATDRWDMEL